MIMPQMRVQTAVMTGPAVPMPSIPATIDAKAAPQVADWMPNQPMHAIARIRLMTYFEPFSPSAPAAMTDTGRPVSQACIPIQII